MNDRICDKLVDNARVWLAFEDLSVPDKKEVKKK